ncbi:MAG: type II secretion system F family protein [Candidatus Omnitrophica bacterium]|nr:type II secretion system F family protein [Candidatus Omnitrophota bacterium]
MRGEVIAPTREEVAARLQEAGVYVTSIYPIRWARPFLLRFGPGHIPQEDLLVFLESWALFLEAGLSMQSALLRLRMRARVRSLEYGIEQLQLAVDSGATLTEGLRASRLLPSSWIAVIAMGEKNGDYAQPLRMLYKNCLDFQRFKRELMYQMIMPFVLLTVMACWFWLLFNKVLPSLADLMEVTGHNIELPGLVVTFFDFVAASAQWVAPVGIGILLVFLLWMKQIGQDSGLSQLWIPHSTPVIGPLVQKMQLILVAKGLQMQLESGIPFANAVESISQGVRNEGVRRDLLQLYRKLREGVPIPEAIAGFRLIPQMGQALLVAGHASGKMPEMLGCLVQESESILLEDIKRVTIFVKTMVIITSGLTVGIVVIAFFMLLFGAMGSVTNAGSTLRQSMPP